MVHSKKLMLTVQDTVNSLMYFFWFPFSMCIFDTCSVPNKYEYHIKFHSKLRLENLKKNIFFFSQISNLKSFEFCGVSDYTQNFITLDADTNKKYELRNSVTGLSYRVLSCRAEPCRVAT